jgi:thiol-disulfide isomerase/thioredoxin
MNFSRHAGLDRSIVPGETNSTAAQSGGWRFRRRSVVRKIVLVSAVGTILILWLFRASLQNRIIETEILSNDSPPPELVKQTILNSADPRATLLAAWNSGKIVHREAAIQSLREVISDREPLPPPFDALLKSATLDPDMNVRETAFAILRERQDPMLAALASAQLNDPDHMVRQLGLNQLKFVRRETGLPLVIPLLNDGDPLIVITSLHLLENWSGERFGVKFADMASVTNGEAGQEQTPAETNEKVKAGIRRANVWWAQHRTEFPPVALAVPETVRSAQLDLPAGDFELRGLDGKKVRFSDFRGKTILINFWTTWCTACVGEIPSLIALQNKHRDDLVILGVSLDAIPDEEGDNPGGSTHSGSQPSVDLQRLRDNVGRTVKQRGINYPVLIDEKNVAGGRFNGGELPTTVLVDAQGNIRRRFVGARSLPEFEAMIAGTSQAQPH